MTLSAVHRPLNPPFRRAPGASVRPRLLAFFVGGSVFAPLFADQKAAKDPPVEDCDRYFLRKKGTKKSCGRRPRLSSFRCKRYCGGLKPASAGDGGILREHANMRTWANTPCSHVRVFVTRASRSRQPQPKSRVSSGSARCCGTPRDRPRSEARYTRCGPIRCTRSAKRR